MPKNVLWNYMGKTTSQRRWSESAIMCYKRGCVCNGCFYEEFFRNSGTKVKCQMKAAVIELMRTIGKPPETNEKTIIKED